MIYTPQIAQDFVDIIKDIEAVNVKLAKAYINIYGHDEEENPHFKEAERSLNNAYDATASLLSDILIRED